MDEDIRLHSVMVTDFDSNEIVWSIGTYDPLKTIIINDNEIDMKKTHELTRKAIEGNQAIIIKTLRFGVVPNGFDQYSPPDCTIPKLQAERLYVIDIMGNGSGREKFYAR